MRTERGGRTGDREGSPANEKFRVILTHSALEPRHAAILGVAAVGALLVGSWWLLVFGVLGFGAASLRKALDPAYGRRILATADERPALPCRDDLVDPDLRRVVDALAAARTRLDGVVEQTSTEVTAYLGTLLAEVGALEASAGALIRRTDELSRSIRGLDRAAVVADHDRLAALAALAADASAKRDYEQAVAVRRQDLRVIDDLIAHQMRVGARLWHTVAVLDGLPARIIHMRLLDAAARDDLSNEVDDELQRIRTELTGAELTFSGLLEAPRAAAVSSPA